MSIVNHDKGGFLVDPKLLGGVEFLIDHLQGLGRHGGLDSATKLILSKVVERFELTPPVVVHSAQSLEKTNDPA